MSTWGGKRRQGLTKQGGRGEEGKEKTYVSFCVDRSLATDTPVAVKADAVSLSVSADPTLETKYGSLATTDPVNVFSQSSETTRGCNNEEGTYTL